MRERDIYEFADELRNEVIKAYENNTDVFELVVTAKFTHTDWTVDINVGKWIGLRKIGDRYD